MREITALSADRVTKPDDLPPELFLGVRDDASFYSDGSLVACTYRYDGHAFIELNGSRTGWKITRFAPNGGEISRSFAKGALGEALKQFMAGTGNEGGRDPWEQFIKTAVEAEGLISYAVNTPRTEPAYVFVPDGFFKFLVLPLGAWSRVVQLDGDLLTSAWSRHGARLKQKRVTRRFEFFRLNAMPASFAEATLASIGAMYGTERGTARRSRDVYPPAGVEVDHVQLLQPVDLLIGTVALRNLVPLVRVLRAEGLIAPRTADPLVASAGVYDFGDVAAGRTTLMSVGDLRGEPDRIMYEAHWPLAVADFLDQ